MTCSIRRTVLCLGLGAAVNVLAAWGIAVRSPMAVPPGLSVPAGVPAGTEAPRLSDGGPVTLGRDSKTSLFATRETETIVQPPVGSAAGAAPDRVELNRVKFGSGFPLASMGWSESLTVRYEGGEAVAGRASRSGAAVLGSEPRIASLLGVHENRLVPLMPRPLGFSVDTLVFAAGFLALFTIAERLFGKACRGDACAPGITRAPSRA